MENLHETSSHILCNNSRIKIYKSGRNTVKNIWWNVFYLCKFLVQYKIIFFFLYLLCFHSMWSKFGTQNVYNNSMNFVLVFLSVMPTFVARFRRNTVQEFFFYMMLEFHGPPKDVCTNPRAPSSCARLLFVAVARNICGTSARNLFLVTFRATEILRWFRNFGKNFSTP